MSTTITEQNPLLVKGFADDEEENDEPEQENDSEEDEESGEEVDCPECGVTVEGGTIKCPECGADMDPETEEDEEL